MDRKDKQADLDKSSVQVKPALADRELLRSCCLRKKGAWEDFLEKYSKLIYFAIHRTLHLKHYRATPEEIEDLFSDVLVHMIKDDCRKLRLFRGDEGCSVATWIRTITVRFILDYLRQRSRGGVMIQLDGEEVSLEVSLVNPVVQPDQILEESEQDRVLNSAIQQLGESERNFMELYYIRGLKPDQVAEVMGISIKTVYSRNNRIVAKLKDEIRKSGRKR